MRLPQARSQQVKKPKPGHHQSSPRDRDFDNLAAMPGFSYTGAPDLAGMCLRKALDNIHLIEDVTGLPDKYLRILLGVVKTPAQLRKIELNSDVDEIYELTAPQWQRFIDEDFADLAAKQQFEPSSPTAWHEVYERYKKIHDAKIAADTEMLMKAFAARDQEKIKRSATIIAPQKNKLPRPPRPKTTGWGAPRAPQTFLQKARAEVRVQAQRFKLGTPSGRSLVPSGQIMKAPQSRINDARIASQPSILEAPRIRAPRVVSALPGKSLESARKEGKAPHKGKEVAGEEDDDDLDDLFGDGEGGGGDLDDLFGDNDTNKTIASVPLPSREAPRTSLSIQTQSSKRPPARDGTTSEPIAKRQRSVYDTASANLAAVATTSTAQPKRSGTNDETTASSAAKLKRSKGLGLSASPGANNVLKMSGKTETTSNAASPTKPTPPGARQSSPNTPSGPSAAASSDRKGEVPRRVVKLNRGTPTVMRPNFRPGKARK
ncbi:hypothetical protein VTJ83DRAFT_522 [Remersonia thermophila]|uniref:Elongin-A n=1 Tax=Remersonia thermophila TaxID=72144 RepID=A0ABR4DLK8_9PEZI